MAVKGFLLAGLGLFLFLGLASTPRVLERGVKAYLQKSFPGSQADVHVSAPLFWFFSGNVRRVSVRLARFDASQFPLPVAGAAPSQVTEVQPGSSVQAPGSVSERPSDPAAPEGRLEAAVVSGVEAAGAQISDLRISDLQVPDQADLSPERSDAGQPDDPTSAASEPGRGAGRRTETGRHNDGDGGRGWALNEGEVTRRAQANRAAPKIRWAKIGQIVLDLSDFTFKGQHIERLQANIPDVKYDYGLARRKHLLELGGSGQGVLKLTLSEADINGAVTLDRSDIRALHVIPEAGNLRVTLDYRTLLGWVPVAVTGELAVEEGHALWFVNPALSVVRVPLPQTATDLILGRVQNLNPVFDLNHLDLPMDVRLTTVSSAPGVVTVTGLIRIPGAGSEPGQAAGTPPPGTPLTGTPLTETAPPEINP